MSRPDFEALYKICFRQYVDFLNEIGAVFEGMDRASFTHKDAIQTIRRIHEKHAIAATQGGPNE